MASLDSTLDSPTVRIDRLRALFTAISLLAAAYMLYRLLTVHTGGGVVLVIMFVWLVLAGYAATGLGKAPCPDCGRLRTVFGLKNNDSVRCKDCGTYFRTEGGRVAATAADAIEGFPAFAAACPGKQIVWPPGCCVCGGHAVRWSSVKLTLPEDAPIGQGALVTAVSLGTLRLSAERTYEVWVPVCASEHDPVAELELNDHDAQLYLKFRSRPYTEAFIAANGPVFWDS